jgi:hypothetical protein
MTEQDATVRIACLHGGHCKGGGGQPKLGSPLSPLLLPAMALGTLETEAQLEQFVRGVLDRVGLGRADSGVADKSLTIGKLADALVAVLAIVANGDFNRMAAGSTTLTWTGPSTASANATVTHGLTATGGGGVTPKRILLGVQSLPFAAGVVITPKTPVASRGTTTFLLNAEANVAVTGSVVVDWLAIG